MNEDQDVKENPDIAYIKRDDIGVVIAKGLATLYRTQPENPVDYLAKWLLNFSNVKNESNLMLERKQKVQELKDKKDLEQQDQSKEKEEEQKKEKETNAKIDDFKDKIENTEDLADLLQQYAYHLQEFTGATGVYIGKLIKPEDPSTNEKAAKGKYF